MSDYKHGAYGLIQAAGSRVADESQSAIVYVGTAPVHILKDYSGAVNVPILVHNMAEARQLLGYSDDWASYTLCEAMYVHFALKGVGPLVMINVLDPATHKAGTKTSASATPINGVAIVQSAQSAIISTVTVTSGETAKTEGTDYELEYDIDKKQLIIRELTAGALGTDALTVEYYAVAPANVTAAQVIGSTNNLGQNTGMYGIKSVYQLTGKIPAFIAAPGWSSVASVHAAMVNVSRQINGHWDAYIFADLPLADGSTALTLDTVVTYKNANGYNQPNETVYYPMALGTDDKHYHLSVLAAGNFQELLISYDDIPYHTASNTEVSIVKSLYTTGAAVANYVIDVETINQKLNKNGIASAAFVSGRWAIWGCHSADYNQADADYQNVFETNRMMFYYVNNDFQARRMGDVDRPMTPNDLASIVAEEQIRLDALLKINALTFGKVSVNADMMDKADIVNGDFSFTFQVTTTPLAKSLTAVVSWTDAGFVTYYEGFTN